MTGAHLKALKDFALMERVDPQSGTPDEQTVCDSCATVTWLVNNLRTDPTRAIDNSDVVSLEDLSMQQPEALKFTLVHDSDLTPEVQKYVQHLWQQRKLSPGRRTLVSSNNPFNCVAIGLLFMSTAHLFGESDHAVLLVSEWLHVASLMVQHGQSPTFFSSLGVGDDNAFPDIFCHVNFKVRSSTGVVSERLPVPVYLAMETLGHMISKQLYRPSLSNVLQMACIVHSCSEAARLSWTSGAMGALEAIGAMHVDGNSEIRNGLPKCAFSEILLSNHDKILASLCVSVLSGKQRDSDVVAPCVPLLITHGEFAALRTCMLKWIIPPDQNHCLIFKADSDKIEVSCIAPQYEHAWLRDLYLLNATKGLDGGEAVESFNVHTRGTPEGDAYAVEREGSVYETTPAGGNTITWQPILNFDATNYITQKVKHQTLWSSGVQTLPLLNFKVFSKDGSMQTMRSGINTWKILDLNI
mgnify:CR=1 FL=1|tara:strand:- start:954 stop:2360 length:1407 start_codon:yes stop_codon:yes gene_type:complete